MLYHTHEQARRSNGFDFGVGLEVYASEQNGGGVAVEAVSLYDFGYSARIFDIDGVATHVLVKVFEVVVGASVDGKQKKYRR